MSQHQIIYTSCMRGIQGIKDGQQVYSHDAHFQDVQSEEIKGFFTYQHPALGYGSVMDDRLAQTMPSAFAYRRLQNGSCAVALNTYLGRDYMGQVGRFGNYLSHVVLFHPEDSGAYPVQFYGSSMLRTHMEPEEVNNSQRPPFLPTPQLLPAEVVNLEGVLTFLRQADRMEIYKQMLHCMLSFPRVGKRLVICDTPANIIFWIAALEYALPQRNALNVNFSTYDFDPALSASQICGVVPEGTRFGEDSYRQHFVFNFLQGRYVPVQAQEELLEFVDTAMSVSYESLQDFHRFLIAGYCYDRADEALYDAYALYTLLCDGVENLTEDKLAAALQFANTYALPKEKERLCGHLLQERRLLLQGKTECFMQVLQYLLQQDPAQSQREEWKKLLVQRILWELQENQTTEEAFMELYHRLEQLCVSYGIDLARGILESDEAYKQECLQTVWQLRCLLRILSGYIVQEKLSVSDLEPDTPCGRWCYRILHHAYSLSRQNGFIALTRILSDFEHPCGDYVNMSLNLEGMLLDLPDGQQEADALWHYVQSQLLTDHADRLSVAYGILDRYHRFDQVYRLYVCALTTASDLMQKRSIFRTHWLHLRSAQPQYRTLYGVRTVEQYCTSLRCHEDDAVYELKYELFAELKTEGMLPDHADALAWELAEGIALRTPTDTNEKRISELYHYHRAQGKPLPERLKLLMIGMRLQGVRNRHRLHERLKQITQITDGQPVDLCRMPEKQILEYFGWLLLNVCPACDRAEALEAVYDLFVLSEGQDGLFFGQCARVYTKGNMAPLCEFVGVLCRRSTAKGKDAAGMVLKKLSRQRLAELDRNVRSRFYQEPKVLENWADLYGGMTQGSSVLQNFAGLFRRRQDDTK